MDSHHKKVFERYKEKDFTACLQLIAEASPETRESTHYKMLKATSLVNLGKMSEAHKIYDEILEVNEGNATAHCGKGLAYHRQKKFAQAMSSVEKAMTTLLEIGYKIHENKAAEGGGADKKLVRDGNENSDEKPAKFLKVEKVEEDEVKFPDTRPSVKGNEALNIVDDAMNGESSDDNDSATDYNSESNISPGGRTSSTLVAAKVRSSNNGSDIRSESDSEMDQLSQPSPLGRFKRKNDSGEAGIDGVVGAGQPPTPDAGSAPPSPQQAQAQHQQQQLIPDAINVVMSDEPAGLNKKRLVAWDMRNRSFTYLTDYAFDLFHRVSFAFNASSRQKHFNHL